MLHNVTHTINYATIFVLNYARKLGILTLISTITFRLAYARGLWIWRCRIANAQMVDSADPLMIINETASNGDGCHCKISSIHPSVRRFRFSIRNSIRRRDEINSSRRKLSKTRTISVSQERLYYVEISRCQVVSVEFLSIDDPGESRRRVLIPSSSISDPHRSSAVRHIFIALSLSRRFSARARALNSPF